MTVELYVILSVCILGLIYLSKSDNKKEQRVKVIQKINQKSKKTVDEISDMYFDSLRQMDDMYREFKERELKNEVSKKI